MSTLPADARGLIVPCPSCGQKNRIAWERLDETGRCGRCQTDLPPAAAPVEVQDAAQFDRIMSASPLPIVVDFWAPWCGPCRMVAPELEKVAAAGARQFLIVKVNTEAIPALAERFQVRSIPTLAVFRSGQLVAREAGARPAPAIETFIRQALGT